jgi:ATP-dependent Clp protease adapter protein ClpS
VIPVEDENAYKLTLEIHEEESAMVYQGPKEHCEKIGAALEAISVEYKIQRD